MDALITPKLQIKNVVKFYNEQKDTPALDDVSFDVRAGELLSILGPSGCGKTTLLKILIGLIPPTSGSVYLDGKDITHLPSSKRSMGIVFQNYALFENMTVLDNVVYAAYLKAKREKSATKAEIREKAEDMLDMLGVSHVAGKYPGQLSGGQQQRVAIARTLIHNPAIMLFDEPMSALDVATRLQLRDVIKQIQRDFGTTMIYITHDQEEAFAMSDRIMIMREANVVQLDTPENIVDHPADEYVENFVLKNLQIKIDSLMKCVRA